MKRRAATALMLMLGMLLLGTLCGAAEVPKKSCSHEWELISTTNPTCKKKGKETYKCTLCGKKKKKELAALGHDWSYCTIVEMPTCTEPGITRCYCSRDNTHTKDDTQPALGHSWSEWTVVRQADLTWPGLKERSCDRCGETEKQQIPQLIRRKKYALEAQAFTTGSGFIPGEALRMAGKEGLELSCVCALANTGKSELWIQRVGEEPLPDRLRLKAGEVRLLSLETRIHMEDFGPEGAKIQLLFAGETEAGVRVCEAEAVTAPLWLAADGEAEAPGTQLAIEQELMAPEGTEYRVGETLRYSLRICNTEADPLKRVVVRDLAGTWTLENLRPGEIRMENREYTVTKQDAIAGYLCWTAWAGLPEDEAGATAQSCPLIVAIRVDERN